MLLFDEALGVERYTSAAVQERGGAPLRVLQALCKADIHLEFDRNTTVSTEVWSGIEAQGEVGGRAFRLLEGAVSRLQVTSILEVARCVDFTCDFFGF